MLDENCSYYVDIVPLKICVFFKAGFFSYITLYSIMMTLKYHVFEKIMGNGAFAPLGQMLYFP